MPALDILSAMSGEWRNAFDSVLPEAREFANRLPLVRVVVPKDRHRRAAELVDVLKFGRLHFNHRSARTVEIDSALELEPSVYFHLGRTHPDYGDVVVVLRELESVEATPFGVGALLCDGAGEVHDRGSCLSPVSHASIESQRAFVRDSVWIDSNWRENVAKFCAAYFDRDLAGYLKGERPRRHDPEGIYSEPSNRDWRSWTVEVRARSVLDLTQSLKDGHLIAWAISDALWTELTDQSLALGESVSDLYPFLATLPETLRVRSSTPSVSLFEQVDRHIFEKALKP